MRCVGCDLASVSDSLTPVRKPDNKPTRFLLMSTPDKMPFGWWAAFSVSSLLSTYEVCDYRMVFSSQFCRIRIESCMLAWQR